MVQEVVQEVVLRPLPLLGQGWRVGGTLRPLSLQTPLQGYLAHKKTPAPLGPP